MQPAPSRQSSNDTSSYTAIVGAGVGDGVTLRYNAQTLEEAAGIFHTTVENLKELNPDWQDKYSRAFGCYWALKVQAEP